MSRFKRKSVLRRHDEESYRDLGVVVLVDGRDDRLWYVPYPEKQQIKAADPAAEEADDQCDADKPSCAKVRTRHYIREPDWVSLSAIEADAAWSCHPAVLPSIMGLNDEQLLSDTPPPPQLKMCRRTRRNLKKAKAKRDKLWRLIEDLVKLPDAELLDKQLLKKHCDAVRTKLRESADPIVLKDDVQIVRALRCYWLWGMTKNALIPRHDLSNDIGQPKRHTMRPGRTNSKFPSGEPGVLATDVVRSQLRRGWNTYKISKRISVTKAYHLTMVEFYGDDGNGGYLYPAHERPTLEQFKLHGPEPEKSAKRINLGDNKYLRGARPLRGSARDGLVAVGQVVFADSSGAKQHLVSSRSRLQGLSTCYETLVVEGITGYISGHYSGFEHPNNLTGLMALGNAASDKSDYLRYYHFDPTEHEWLGVSFSRVRTDNGELKNESGIQTLDLAGVCAEFVKSYAAELKAPVESKHHSMNRNSSQLMAGGHDGKPSERGDMDPRTDACMNHFEHVQARIRAILAHNNDQLVPYLLTDEMRNDGVKPTRACILKWYMDQGIVKTESPDMETLRAQCLPRLECSIFRRYIKIWDPTSKDPRRYIGNLKYSVKALEPTGCLADLGEKHLKSEALINPNQLSKIWVLNGRWYECQIISNDPLIHERTLLDHLRNCQDDRDTEAELHNETENAAAQTTARQHQASEKAKRAKRKEQQIQKAGTGTKSPKKGLRVATEEEKDGQRRKRLGLPDSDPPPADAANAPNASAPQAAEAPTPNDASGLVPSSTCPASLTEAPVRAAARRSVRRGGRQNWVSMANKLVKSNARV